MIEDALERAEVLAALAPHLPLDSQNKIWQQALDAAIAIEAPWDQADILVEFALQIPEDLCQSMINVAMNLESIGYRVQILAALATKFYTRIQTEI